MGYDPLLSADIQAGKPTKEEIFEKLRLNQESFDTDIELLKQTARVDIFDFKVVGNLDGYTSDELTASMPTFRSPLNIDDIIEVRMILLEASTSGTLELEIDKSTDNGVNWSPMLNNPVELTGTSVGSTSGAVDFVGGGGSVAENDLLRIRITGVQVAQGNFHVSIYGEVA